MVLLNRKNFNNPKLFEEFEALARRWARLDELRETERISI
jgi:hypothetical protein